MIKYSKNTKIRQTNFVFCCCRNTDIHWFHVQCNIIYGLLNHGLVNVNDCEITLIDKTDSSDPRRWEFFCFWMRLLKTYYPLGLNIEEQL